VVDDSRNIMLWRLFNALVDMIITPSKSERRNLIEAFRVKPQKIVTIYHGVDRARFKPLQTIEYEEILLRYGISSSFMLHVSSYQEKKNVERIIATYAYLKKKFHIKEKLVVVGNHPEARLRKFAVNVGLSAQDILFMGVVPDDDLPAFYNGATCIVFPSLHESFGMPILEAMACGCPVVTSNAFACPEVAGNAALLVNPFDVKEMALAIYRVLSDAELRAELITRGLERARCFTWERCVLMHLKLYKAVAELK